MITDLCRSDPVLDATGLPARPTWPGRPAGSAGSPGCRPVVAPCQILRKRSAADHDSEWATAPAADPLFIQASPLSAQQLARISTYQWWDTSGGALTLSLPRPRHLALAAQRHQPQPDQSLDVGLCPELLAGVQRAPLHQRPAACGHPAVTGAADFIRHFRQFVRPAPSSTRSRGPCSPALVVDTGLMGATPPPGRPRASLASGGVRPPLLGVI